MDKSMQEKIKKINPDYYADPVSVVLGNEHTDVSAEKDQSGPIRIDTKLNSDLVDNLTAEKD